MKEERLLQITLLICIWAVGVMAVYRVYGGLIERRCLAAGWSRSAVTWNFEAYCIREENEYEITRPLSEISK